MIVAALVCSLEGEQAVLPLNQLKKLSSSKKENALGN